MEWLLEIDEYDVLTTTPGEYKFKFLIDGSYEYGSDRTLVIPMVEPLIATPYLA